LNQQGVSATCQDFDANLPCSNYSRKDVEYLAKQCGIKSISKKRKDDLCKELNSVSGSVPRSTSSASRSTKRRRSSSRKSPKRKTSTKQKAAKPGRPEDYWSEEEELEQLGRMDARKTPPKGRPEDYWSEEEETAQLRRLPVARKTPPKQTFLQRAQNTLSGYFGY
jgi:hypothetical protein